MTQSIQRRDFWVENAEIDKSNSTSTTQKMSNSTNESILHTCKPRKSQKERKTSQTDLTNSKKNWNFSFEILQITKSKPTPETTQPL